MNELFNVVNEFISGMISFLGVYGPFLGCILIVLESILPMLPLCVFITLNCLSFGYSLGFLISWICTCLGCLLSFFLCDKLIKNWFDKKIRVMPGADNIMKVVEKASVSELAMIIAVPFTPAFLINIAAGLSKMSVKRFMTAILIGKFFMVYFWAFIGTNLVQSLSNPIILVKVIGMVFIAYILSKVVTKKFNL